MAISLRGKDRLPKRPLASGSIASQCESTKGKTISDNEKGCAMMGVGIVRNEVLGFSLMMEIALKRNDHKGGWQRMSSSQIMNRIYDEVRELNAARKVLEKGAVSQREIDATKKEAVDIANFCMMMVDVL